MNLVSCSYKPTTTESQPQDCCWHAADAPWSCKATAQCMAASSPPHRLLARDQQVHLVDQHNCDSLAPAATAAKSCLQLSSGSCGRKVAPFKRLQPAVGWVTWCALPALIRVHASHMPVSLAVMPAGW